MKYIGYGLLTSIALILLIPTLLLVEGAFRTDEGLGKMPPEIIPESFTLRNFERLFHYPITLWTANSLFVAILSTSIMLIITVTAGYGFAKKEIPAKKPIFWTMVASIMIPGTVMFVPMFVLLKNLHLVNTLWGLIVPSGMSVPMMFYYREYAKDFPDEFIMMAEIDGCSELRTFVKIVLPMTKVAIMTIALLTIIGTWKDFLMPLILLYDREKFTLPLGMQQVLYDDAMQRGLDQEVNFGLMMAGATYVFAPMIIMFTAFHRYFAKGLWGGGLKS